MKRTLTAAAAVLVGGAGAVGFAATANAAETPQLPAELPTDNNLAQTAYHFAGTLQSAQQTVGDVVPVEERIAGRSGGGEALGGLTGALGSTPAGSLLGGVTGGKSLDPSSALGAVPVGDVVPALSVSPVARTDGPTNDLLPIGVDSALPGTPQTKPAQLPPAQQDVDVVGEAVHGVASSTPLAGTQLPLSRSGDALGGITGPQGPLGGLTGELPVGKTDPTTALDKINDVVSHGPLGGVNQLGS
ncbi:hypothetical protein SAMN05216215_102084 [Saccharopolyspora shandongensis]|uniref:GLTT repeat-containing protein n=1 Tax=Saccharopolyspora shandongensis TaxID=418495 RepID=A0A1H3HBF0_9PSEU|nr:hypothetical protein [Saccharopolyspora shandongensis]SDY12802.1 hypothetical protein SAMN05216215_102084 [Saccharopolyspora shandongensis]